MAGQNKSSLEEKFKLVADTIRAYPQQLRQAWDEINATYLPEDYQNIKNVVLCGMGGSALGARIVDSLVMNRLRVPFEIYNEFHLPNYVNDETLVIVSSYSGNTEETIEATNEAISRGAKIFGIATGGKLAKLLQDRKTPSYIFNPINNPSGQPRMSTGYAIGSVLGILNKVEVINMSNEEIEEAVSSMNEALTAYNEGSPKDLNLAYKYSRLLKHKAPILVSSEHLVGTTYTIKNQFNESAKTFCVLFDIPELKHHLREGLKNRPKS